LKKKFEKNSKKIQKKSGRKKKVKISSDRNPTPHVINITRALRNGKREEE
jgi:hypothetical protein